MILHLKNKILSLHHEIDIYNADESLAYKVESKPISLTDKTVLLDASGKEIANIHRKPISIHEIYYVEMNDGTQFELSTELLHVVDEVIRIDALGLEIKGNFLEHDFTIEDGNGTILASCAKKWVSVHESYELDIKEESKENILVAVYCVLEHILVQREQVSMDDAARHHSS